MILSGGSNLTKIAANNLYIGTKGTYASLTASSNGKIDFPTDGSAIYRDNGTTLDAWGPIFPFTTPLPATSTTVTTTISGSDVLNGAINNSQTNITFTTALAFENNDVVQIDSEQILLAGASGFSYLTCTRGYNSTAAASHSSGAVITMVTKGSTGGTFPVASITNFPSLAFITIDSEVMQILATNSSPNRFTVQYRGSAGTSAAAHNAGATVALNNWTWVNQASSTVTTTNGGVYLANTASAGINQISGRITRTPTSTPYHYEAVFLPNLNWTWAAGFGMFFYEQLSSGKCITLAIFNGTTAGTPGYLSIYVTNWSSTTALVSHYVALGYNNLLAPAAFMRIGFDGTNLTFDISSDATNWIQLYTQNYTTYFPQAPQFAGFFIDNALTSLGTNLISWKQTS